MLISNTCTGRITNFHSGCRLRVIHTAEKTRCHATRPPNLIAFNRYSRQSSRRGPGRFRASRFYPVKLLPFRSPRTLCRVALTVLLTLLLQQVAMAGYACPLVLAPVQQHEMMAECDGMEMEDAPALCEKHCNPDDSTAPDLKLLSVPALALPPARFALPQSLNPLPLAYASVPVCKSDPPPLLRFCSLQI